MSLEAIKEISDAEETARKIRTDAAQSAKQAISDAETAGGAAIAASIEKANAELRELNAQADERAKGQASELAKNTAEKKASMRAVAESRLDKAASLVVERIVNS